MPRHFISLKDFTKSQILSFVKRALQIKHSSHPNNLLQNKTLAMIFTKPSTRTRISAETGWAYYGGHPLFLGSNDLQLGNGEPLHVTSKVVSSMADCILARVGKHQEIIELAENSRVPVINALTETYHPLQILADLTTLYETFVPNVLQKSGDGPLPDLPPLNIAWIGDANNILNSMLVTYPRLGLNVSVATPKGYNVDEQVLRLSRVDAVGEVKISHDPVEAVKAADVIVTDTWISMGHESEKSDRLSAFKGFQVTERMARDGGANPTWKFLHCLPRKPYEVDDEVFYHPTRSLVYTEAENRKYTVMAVFEYLMLHQ